MDRQQALALFFTLLMLFSSLAYGLTLF